MANTFFNYNLLNCFSVRNSDFNVQMIDLCHANLINWVYACAFCSKFLCLLLRNTNG